MAEDGDQHVLPFRPEHLHQRRMGKRTGRWYQYALVYDGDSFRMYLDGELQDEETLSDEVKAGYAASSNPPVFQAIEFNSS